MSQYTLHDLNIGETRKTKVNEVGADDFFCKRLAKKQSEDKAELRGVLRLQTFANLQH